MVHVAATIKNISTKKTQLSEKSQIDPKMAQTG